MQIQNDPIHYSTPVVYRAWYFPGQRPSVLCYRRKNPTSYLGWKGRSPPAWSERGFPILTASKIDFLLFQALPLPPPPAKPESDNSWTSSRLFRVIRAASARRKRITKPAVRKAKSVTTRLCAFQNVYVFVSFPLYFVFPSLYLSFEILLLFVYSQNVTSMPVNSCSVMPLYLQAKLTSNHLRNLSPELTRRLKEHPTPLLVSWDQLNSLPKELWTRGNVPQRPGTCVADHASYCWDWAAPSPFCGCAGNPGLTSHNVSLCRAVIGPEVDTWFNPDQSESLPEECQEGRV